MEPPWKAYNVLRKMDYPYEVSTKNSVYRPNSLLYVPPHMSPFFTFQHIVHSMKDPSIANFWLITLPQIVGGFDYDEDVKKKIWLQYEVSTSFCLT